MFRRGLMVAGALALVVTGAAQAVAQRDFPTKPVRLVIPYPPGGSHDAHARAFASVRPANPGFQHQVHHGAEAPAASGQSR